MSLAWIESHQELARHPKTKRFTRLLGTSLPTAIGHLHLFWWWAMDYAQDGDLSRYESADIADACEWDGASEKLLEALIHAGFVNEDLSIHNWFEYVGRLLEKKEQNKERKRKSRAKKKEVTSMDNDGHADVTGTSLEQSSDDRESHRATKPNLTKPNHSSSNSEIGGENDENFSKAYRVIESNFGLVINPIQISELERHLASGMEPELIEHAVSLTRKRGKDISYFWGILERCEQKGIRTALAFEEEQARWKEEQHAESSKGSKRGRDPTPSGESEFAFLDKPGRS
ncbi:DnaD domain protein [Paenibacillus popilliae]|nr:DnaD domain protein [Paenibacillus popilliae]